jgi:hypothetical protein
MEYTGSMDDPMTVEIELNGTTTEPSVYLVGVHLVSGDLPQDDTGSIRIGPKETHILSYVDGTLWVNITYPNDMPPEAMEYFYYGTYEDLPKEYRTHIGQIEWEGHVGEPEEAPGFGTLLSLMAMTAIAVLLVRGRRR